MLKNLKIFVGSLRQLFDPIRSSYYFIDSHNADHVVLLLTSNGYSRVPVLTKDKHYLGTISLADIKRYQDEHNLQEWEMVNRDIGPMTSDVVATVKDDANLSEVMHKLVDNPFLAVVDSQGIFKGIITRKSILKAVNSLLHDFTHDYIIIPKQLTTQITDFLARKTISDSSKQAYAYDLKQFVNCLPGRVDQTSLKLYENQLKEWKPSVQKRKRSAVNQFLLYLYQKGELEEFFKLSETAPLPSQQEELERFDLSSLYEGQEGPGKLACLFILELGLLPSEILELKWEDIDLDFGVVTVAKGSTKRVLRLDGALKELLFRIRNDNSQGLILSKAFTRQWLYKQIQSYVGGCGLSGVTAQVLRQQYILRQIEKGTGAFELARLLGLKSPVTLEKYYKT